jgi:hypothetical protein
MSFENGQDYSAAYELSEGEFSLLATVVYDETLDYSAAYELSEGEFPLLGTVYYDETLNYSAAYEFSESDFALLSLNLTFDPGQNISIFALPPNPGDDTQIITYESHKPEPPPDLEATALSSTEIELSWTDNNPDEVGFFIERKTVGGTFSVITFVPSDTKIYIDGNLASSTEYIYRVAALFSGGILDYSNEASATTSQATTFPFCENAKARLAEQFKGSYFLKDFICSLTDECSELDIVYQELKFLRAVDTASGEQLLQLADLVGAKIYEMTVSEARAQIRHQISINVSNGEPESVINYIKTVTGSSSISYTEVYPAKISIFFNGGTIPTGLIALANQIAPAGVGVVLTSSYGDGFSFAVSPEGGVPDPDGFGFGEINLPAEGGRIIESITV